MASSSSSSLLLSQKEYDVFVSFRGTDVRHGFLSHLTKELHAKQIDAYVDERLESGEEISSALMTAIEGSMISLVIFSQHYATSKWCLEELVKIMDCKKHNGQIVVPVFYNVDPTHVRYQRGTYGDAFVEHEQKYFKDKVGKLQSWRSALNNAANLSGHHYPSQFKNESELITVIVQDVLKKLKLQVDSPLYEPRLLVGFQKHFSCVESLLEFESQDVRIIGIWGMGGIGKTTLAQALFDKFSSQFQSSCFLENVREESEKTNGLNHLLQKLYCQLLEEQDLNIYDTNTKHSIKRRLARKRVLIVLDDVTTVDQLEKLVGKEIYLGSGSRIIITSRDRHVLDCKGIHVHGIGELSEEESLELFSLYAFDEREPKIGYEKLSKDVIMYAKGIPLAITVLGSHFGNRTEEEWKDALKELQKYPDKEIQKVLRVSYNGLTKSQQDIFLDIAFFFKGHQKDDVIAVLNACGFFPIIGIKVLQEKALITISNDNRVKMHDLLQEMGEQVVREESYNHPERRSRLKDTDELYELFRKNNGTDKIEGIVFDVLKIKNVCLSKDTFKQMPKLRILKMYSESSGEESNVNVSFGIVFPDELRYFHWDKYPLESLPPTFNTEKLVEFHMQCSQVPKLWDEVKELGNLKILNLRGSKHLIELPDFSKAINLERLVLSDCESLLRVHPSIYSLPKPVYLEVDRCHGLSNVVMTKLCCFKSLKQLSLKGCKQVNKMVLQMVFDVSRCLERLDLDACNNLLELPATIKHLPKLQNMKLNGCNKLRSIPELPPTLKLMHAQYCWKLKTIAVPFRNSMVEGKGEPWDLDFSFKDSVNLDEGIAMKFNSLSLMQAIYRDCSGNEHSACYPATTIPCWFTYKETSECTFIVKLVPPSDSDQLLGFVLCGILPQLASGCRICFFFFFEDGDCYWRGYSNRMFDMSDSNKDLAFMWFVPHNKILPKADEGRKFDEMGCYYICEAFGEAVEGAACGVCPIYASQLDNIVAEILASNTSYHDDNDDENHKPDDIQTQPHFQINLNRINPTPLDKQNQRKGLQLFQ